jgi:NLI interacting factor-like phosphatase
MLISGSEAKKDVINTIKYKLSDPIKYRVVLDVDDVLCCRLSDQNPNKTDKAELERYFPEGIAIDWRYENISYLHYFYPGFDKLILSILSWGWSVDFFSAGQKVRNEEVIPTYLKETFKQYSNDVDADYAAILDSGRLRIFSYHHMTPGKSNNDGSILTGYEQCGLCKKDLTVVSPDIDNTILVDDDRSYVPGTQYPYIGMSYSSSLYFKGSVLPEKNRPSTERDKWELKFHPNNNAAYIMGILLDCRQKLAQDQLRTLREALGLVLSHNGRSSIGPSDSDYSPWYLHPCYELRMWDKRKSEFEPQMNDWIQKGNKCFEDLIEYGPPADSYKKAKITTETDDQECHMSCKDNSVYITAEQFDSKTAGDASTGTSLAEVTGSRQQMSTNHKNI